MFWVPVRGKVAVTQCSLGIEEPRLGSFVVSWFWWVFVHWGCFFAVFGEGLSTGGIPLGLQKAWCNTVFAASLSGVGKLKGLSGDLNRQS